MKELSMIIQAHTLPDSTDLSAHLAVVGAGPAGIVIALEAAKHGFDVLLVESGYEKFNAHVQQLSDAAAWDSRLHSPMSLTVRRQLGGASNLWPGRCVPYDPVDFDHRPAISCTDWPVTYEELLPYFQRACDWLCCGRAVFNVGALSHLPSSLVPGLHDGDASAGSLERWSKQPNFAHGYGDALRQSSRVRVVTGLTCTDVICRPGGTRAGQLACRTIDGKRVSISARGYVLAAGGLETTRLLLASRGPHDCAIGNHSGHLGSWYMGHVLGVIANVRFSTPPRDTVSDFERDLDGTYVRRRFSIDRDVQRRHDLPNAVAWLANHELADARHRSGSLSLTYLILRSPLGRKLMADAPRLSLTGRDIPGSPYRGAETTSIRSHLVNAAKDWRSVIPFAVEFGGRRFLAHEAKAPGFFVSSPANVYPLEFQGEHIPNRNSRVSLSSERDAVGMPKLNIDLRFSQQDVDGILRCHEVWDDYLKRSGCGRLEYISQDPSSLMWHRLGGGFHQQGTTRMAARAEDGVVDKHLAVHGMSNLFVASSSTFLTSGQANPTFMILVFALRLADRLKSVLPEL
jgi:choline dehydrogenase-like flavoprotein